MIIAVDFDGTLCDDMYPDIGKVHWELVCCLRYRQELGDKIILWTCRVGKRLDEALEICDKYWDLHFDAVNENVPEAIEKFGNDSRKITADVYIDDRHIDAHMFCKLMS